MPPAVIAAGVVAAGTIGGAVLGSKSQSKATAQAAQTQDNATAAQLQLGQESLGLNKDIYAELRQFGGDAVPASAGHERAQQPLRGARDASVRSRR
jgi:hypothetical protein